MHTHTHAHTHTHTPTRARARTHPPARAHTQTHRTLRLPHARTHADAHATRTQRACRQDAAALADEARLKAREVSQAEAQLAQRGPAAAVQTLASAPVARPLATGGDATGSLRARAQALVQQQEARERAAEEKSAEQELAEMEQESERWTTHVSDRKAQARRALTAKTQGHNSQTAGAGKVPGAEESLSALKAKLGLSVNQDASLPRAPSGRDALRQQQQQQLELREEERNWGEGGRGTLQDLAGKPAPGAGRMEALMDSSRARSTGGSSSTLEAPARLQMLSSGAAASRVGGGGDGKKGELVAGMQSILADLRRLKIRTSPRAAVQQKKQESATQQQQALLRLADAEHGDGDAGESGALLKQLQKQLFAPLPSSTTAHYLEAGAAQEAAHLHQLVSAVSSPAAVTPLRPAPASHAQQHAATHAASAAESAEAARTRASVVKQRQEDTKMAAIDRLYKRLYGSDGSFLGEHSGRTSRGFTATQQYASRSLPQLRGRSGAPGAPGGGVWSQSLSATTHVQQLQATPAAAEQAAVASEMTRAEKVAAGRAELKKAEEDAERPWSGDGEYGANGPETETKEHEKMKKQRNFVASVLQSMEHKAYLGA